MKEQLKAFARYFGFFKDRITVEEFRDAIHSQNEYNKLTAKYMGHLLEALEITQQLAERIEQLTIEVHSKIIPVCDLTSKLTKEQEDEAQEIIDGENDIVRVICRFEKCKKEFKHKIKTTFEKDMKYCTHCGNKQ